VVVSRGQQRIAVKVGLLELAKQLGDVSRACQRIGYSRESYYRFKRLYEAGGMAALQAPSKRQPVLKNRVLPEIEAAVVDLAIQQPMWGQAHVSRELGERGLIISRAGVRCVWLRHDLETTAKRLNALEAKVASGGIVVTPTQMAALAIMRVDREADGEGESAYPGSCGVQDTLYVGTVDGVGRLFQQTFIDVYSKAVFAKLYCCRKPWTAMELLCGHVLPFFEQHGIRLRRVLTDDGLEYCRRTDRPEDALYAHEYELFLTLKKIEQVRTRARRLPENGICDRFHEMLRNEFYPVALRRQVDTSIDEMEMEDPELKEIWKRHRAKFHRLALWERRFTDLDTLQADLDAFLIEYNERRLQPDRWCYGKTPMQTFLDGVPLVKEKPDAAGAEGTAPTR
jgi:transposase InsO family protein